MDPDSANTVSAQDVTAPDVTAHDVTAQDVTDCLRRWAEGDEQALDRLMPLVYPELRRLARRAMSGEKASHTLQPTALIHEAYLRLARSLPAFRDRVHFYAVTARMMRRILVDHARQLAAVRRGGGQQRLSLTDADGAGQEEWVDLLALDQALEALRARAPRRERVIELRFFAGLTVPETARLLGVSEPTVVTDTRVARA